MKKILLYLSATALSFAQPSWYGELSSSTPSTYIGYGSSSDELEAKQMALNDIASQISVTIDSSFASTIKDENGKVSSTKEQRSLHNTKASLSDYQLLKSEFDDGKYFVALSYENIPSIDKFVRKILKSPHFSPSSQNSYIKNTLIAQELRKAVGSDIDFTLHRQNKKWFIKYKDVLQVLDKSDFSKFFSSVPNQDLDISTTAKNNILKDGEQFYFKVKSKDAGYVSILTVYEDGTVSILLRNVPVKADTLHNMPDKEHESIPEAGLVTKGVETYDLYVAIYSPNKLQFDSFAYADDKLINDEKYKNFDALIGFLESKKYSTLKVITRP